MRPAALALLTLAGCTGAGDPVRAADYGERLVADPAFSSSGFNDFSCATCHAAESAIDPARRYPAYPLAHAAFRASWWGGVEPRLIDAVDFCYVYFMPGDPALDADDPRGRALYEYLVRIGGEGASPALPLAVVENVEDVGRGEAGRGRVVWDAACRTCHGDTHTGRGRLSGEVAIVPEDTIDFAMENGFDPRLVAIEKVRHGPFFGVGGVMPFFAREFLSDEELADVLEYVGL